MDGLDQLFSNAGSWLSGGTDNGAAPNWQKLLTGGLFGAGEIGNLLGSNQRNSYNNFILNLIKNPAKLAAMVKAFQQPLSQSLVQGVTNQVQGDLAQRGLSQAPGIFASTESQALAPYQIQEQQIATQAVLNALGIPPQFSPTTNVSPALASFLKTFGTRTGTGGGTPAGFTLPDSTVTDLGGFTPTAPDVSYNPGSFPIDLSSIGVSG